MKVIVINDVGESRTIKMADSEAVRYVKDKKEDAVVDAERISKNKK